MQIPQLGGFLELKIFILVCRKTTTYQCASNAVMEFREAIQSILIHCMTIAFEILQWNVVAQPR